MVALALLLAAVAGGNLVVTTSPEHTRVGHRVVMRATGQVGDTGHLWIYLDRRSCAQTQSGERRRGRLVTSRPITESFDFERSFRPQRIGTIWVCGYLYANTCDAAGQHCAPATGLPPDAGYSAAKVRVRAR